ncbi:MAG: hypothetical protein ACKVPJ_11980 [Chitinophagales bacterium]
MSDVTWIALIIIFYLLVIRPMMQGFSNKSPGKEKRDTRKATSEKEKPQNQDSGYVDYEEVK